jgi:hypothetical protein
VRESCYLVPETTTSSTGAGTYGGEKIIAEQVRGTRKVEADGEARLRQARLGQTQLGQTQHREALHQAQHRKAELVQAHDCQAQLGEEEFRQA